MLPAELTGAMGMQINGQHVPLSQVNQGGAYKVAFGTAGSLSAEFKIVGRFDQGKSVAEKAEIFVPEEICEIRTDRFSVYAARPKDLTMEERMATAQLYRQFQEQKDSSDTRVSAWEAVGDQEKMQIMRAGFFSVEQIAALPRNEVYKLGPGGNDLHDRANWHVQRKQNERAASESETVRDMMAELEQLRKFKAEKEEAEFARHASIAASETKTKKKKGEVAEAA